MKERAARERRNRWRTAVVRSVEPASEDMVSFVVTPDEWVPHVAGQYCDVRVPGERVVRAFSIVSSPTETDYLEFGVQVLPRGLVSPRIAAAEPGDTIELRGPVGAFFTWTPEMPGRLVLIGAGAGITPLVSMYAHATSAGTRTGSGAGTGAPAVSAPDPIFIVSAKSPERIFRYERYRRSMITRFTATEGRIDRAFLADALEPVVAPVSSPPPQVRICGPLGFIGGVVQELVGLGIPAEAIRSEAFV